MTGARLSYLIDGQLVEQPLAGEELSIGRSPQMGLVVPESVAGISRHHATIQKRAGAWWLIDEQIDLCSSKHIGNVQPIFPVSEAAVNLRIDMVVDCFHRTVAHDEVATSWMRAAESTLKFAVRILQWRLDSPATEVEVHAAVHALVMSWVINSVIVGLTDVFFTDEVRV